MNIFLHFSIPFSMSGSARSGEPGHRHKLWLGPNTLAKRENHKIRAHEARILWLFPYRGKRYAVGAAGVTGFAAFAGLAGLAGFTSAAIAAFAVASAAATAALRAFFAACNCASVVTDASAV
jgi:hypothetical protein